MPLKPEKSSFTLNIANDEERSFPTIGITTKPESSALSDDDKETSENSEASRKFQILSRQGLNPLKPVIIANTEFIPIGEGNKPPDSEGLKIQFGENNIISVNAVTKLFELHRQIRIATARSANQVLSNAKGYRVDSLLENLIKNVRNYLPTAAKPTLEETVDEIIKQMSSMVMTPKATKAYKKNSSVKAQKKAKGAGKAQLPQLKLTVGAQKSGISIGLRTLLKNNKNDPFFRTTIEYAILESITYDIIKYLSGILAIKDAAERNWSIYEIAGDKKFGKSVDTSKFSSVVKKYFEFMESSMGGHAGHLETEAVFGNELKFTQHGRMPDITALIQVFVSAADTLSLYDGFDDSINNDFSTRTQPKLVARGTYVRDGLLALKKMSLVGMYSHRSHKNVAFSMLNPTHDNALKRILEERSETFRESNLDRIHDQFPADMEDNDVYAELLAAIIFNDAMDCSTTFASARSKMSSFDALGVGGPSSISDLDDFYSKLLLDGLAWERFKAGEGIDEGQIEFDPFDSSQPSALFSFLKSQKSKSSEGDLDDYIPLESTGGMGIYRDSFMTGPEYFINLALQRGDEEFKELKAFLTKYRNFTNKYVENIDAMTNLLRIDDAYRELLGYVARDMKGNAKYFESGADCLWKMALIGTYASDRADLIRIFQSAYFGANLNNIYHKEGDGAGIADVPGDPFVKLGQFQYEIKDAAGEPTGQYEFGTVSKQEAKRRVLRMSNQILLRLFLDHKGKLKYNQMHHNSSLSVKHLSGQTHSKSFRGDYYVSKDKEMDRIKDSENLNRGTGTGMDKQDEKGKYVIYRKSGSKYGTPTGGLNKELSILETGVNFGQGRDYAIKKFIDNEHIKDAGIINENQQITFNMARKDKELQANEEMLDFKPLVGTNMQGSVVELSDHQRAFIFYAFIATTIQKSLRVSISSANPSGSKNAYIKLHLSPNEMQGIHRAFDDMANRQNTNPWVEEIEGTSLDNDSNAKYSNWASYYAYTQTKEELTKVSQAIRKRQKFIIMNTIAPAIHAQVLYNQYEKIRKYVKEGDGTNRSKLGISIAKDRKVGAYKKSLDLLTEESTSQMFKSYIGTMLNSSFGYTKEDIPNKKQLKLMIKILTNSGYGLLESEKRGPKTVCHVGITNSMLNTLRYEAYKDTGDKEFLESRRFCINIFKRNEIDSQEMVYPKTFLFSSSHQIIDYDENGDHLNHLKNYLDTWSFRDIVKNIEFTRWRNTQTDETENPFSSLKNAYEPQRRTGSNLVSVGWPRELIINHLYDYALKLYYKFALGIDFNENTFTLSESDIESGEVTGGITKASDDIQNDYDTLINQLERLYPAANIDQKLASELFRSIKIIAANPIYSLRSKVKRVLYPKKFDRVFSLLVNEKDFVLYTPVYDKEFEDIYKTSPNFSYTSKITRPELKSVITGDSFYKNKYLNMNSSKNSSARKYKRNCEEDYPEIFSMYATITILPKGSS